MTYTTPLPKEEIIHLSHHQCRLLVSEQSLTLHVTARIVSLLAKTRQVLAQGRFSKYAFRVLVLLLLAEDEVAHDTLLAGLYCPDQVLYAVLEEWSLTSLAFQEEVKRKQHYLASLKKGAMEAEMQQIRRAIKGRVGVTRVLEQAGFGWTVQTIYKKGYILRINQPQEVPLERENSTNGLFDVI
jgi:DNA-binding winged helix-turn-helix (wHTH) protein